MLEACSCTQLISAPIDIVFRAIAHSDEYCKVIPEFV
jgi:hypothetical protein